MYPYIDMHCDTLTALKGRSLAENDCMLDTKRMKKAGQAAQFFAVCFSDGRPPETPDEDDMALFESCREGLWNAGGITPALTADDIRRNMDAGILSGVLSLEDGRVLRQDPGRLEYFHSRGVRCIGLTWNDENCLAYPHSVSGRGLKPFGFEMVEAMNALGVIIDISHISDAGARDVLKTSTSPVVASHSNCRALSPHSRNLPDNIIRKIADGGGVVGLNFCPWFLTEDIHSNVSRAEDFCRHFMHIIKTGGEDCAALGSDFDGISGELEIKSPTDMPILFRCLEKCGLSPRQMEKLTYKNVLRVMEDSLK